MGYGLGADTAQDVLNQTAEASSTIDDTVYTLEEKCFDPEDMLGE